MTNPTDQITYVDRLSKGLTKREYFAAMAMQGLLANPDLTKTDDVIIAMTSIDAADALIKALNTTAQ